MVRKLVIIGVSFLLLIIIGYSKLNLNNYSVYYATHCPHVKEADPVLVEICNHIWSINGPDLKSPDYRKTGIQYIEDWRVKYQAIWNDKYDLRLAKSNEDKNIYADFYTYYKDPDKGPTIKSLIFNSSGKFIRFTDDEEREEILSSESKKEYFMMIDKTLDAILVAQANDSPKINLQALYNSLNYWRFN
ncbi:hypothetical protein LMG8526HA_01396 [Lactococcus lactis]|uniref:hypothetical protein n=1 Tax=Lactococcus lactis TaxID=1358 RepID=UPI00071C3AA5|nr:hypothetical protein [Lactococcus lactis]KSU12094.1 hypothetical protein LMG8526_0894 [Lactococcus lactis subsp. lactis]MDU0400512.1 hypothetical protein [Lactococcus lactis]